MYPPKKEIHWGEVWVSMQPRNKATSSNSNIRILGIQHCAYMFFFLLRSSIPTYIKIVRKPFVVQFGQYERKHSIPAYLDTSPSNDYTNKKEST